MSGIRRSFGTKFGLGQKRPPRQPHIAKAPCHAISYNITLYHITSYRVIILLLIHSCCSVPGCCVVLRFFYIARLPQRGRGVVDLRCHGSASCIVRVQHFGRGVYSCIFKCEYYSNTYPSIITVVFSTHDEPENHVSPLSPMLTHHIWL